METVIESHRALSRGIQEKLNNGEDYSREAFECVAAMVTFLKQIPKTHSEFLAKISYMHEVESWGSLELTETKGEILEIIIRDFKALSKP